jgi:FAD/FMN-containing dehydrogenase
VTGRDTGAVIRSQVPARLADRIVRPDGGEYEELRHSYAYEGSPAMIIRCESAADVAGGLALARSSGLQLSVRSGGHGVASSSTNDGGILLDLSRMNGVEIVDEAAGLVRIGPGARWSEVAIELGRYGLAISSGDSGDVGVGGLAVSGGVGLLGRKFGLTIDRLRSVEIVTADGSLRHASTEENSDLFWAVRGAGGNFGIVTSFEFEANRVTEVVYASVRYDATDTVALLENWALAVENAPREITAFLYLTPGEPGGELLADSTVLYAGVDRPEARSALARFTEVAPVLASSTVCTNYAALVPRLLGDHRGDAPPHVRSGLVTHIAPEIAGALTDLLSPGTALTVQVKAVGGAINDVDADSTAYAHRHQNFCLVAIGLPENRARLWTAWDKLSPNLDGLYSAFETHRDPALTLAAYPAATLSRLAELKSKFDPEHRFEPNFAWR